MGAAGFWFGSGSDVWSGLGCESEVKTASVIVSVAESESLIAVVLGLDPVSGSSGRPGSANTPGLVPSPLGLGSDMVSSESEQVAIRRCSNGGGALS